MLNMNISRQAFSLQFKYSKVGLISTPCLFSIRLAFTAHWRRFFFLISIQEKIITKASEIWEYQSVCLGLISRQRIESEHINDSKLKAGHQEARQEESTIHLKKRNRASTVILLVKEMQIFSNLYFSDTVVLLPQ